MQSGGEASDASEASDAQLWSSEATMALAGRCRGVLLRGWASRVRRRWGEDAPDLLRADVGVGVDTLPDHPDARAWLPVGPYLRLNEAIVARCCAGDTAAFAAALADDARRSAGFLARTVARRLGPERLLRQAVDAHPQLFDVGETELDGVAGDRLIRYSGARVFDQPTWRFLQLFGLRLLIESGGADLRACDGAARGPTTFDVRLRW